MLLSAHEFPRDSSRIPGTTTVSETYIVLAAALGIFVNREKIKKHQIVGMALAIAGALTLAYLTG